MKTRLLLLLSIPLSIPLVGCSSSSGGSSSPSVTGVQIVTVSGTALTAAAGDALALKVVETLADGTTQDVPAGDAVVWSGPPTVTASSPDGTPSATPYPTLGDAPTALWIANPGRPDHTADLSGILFVLDAGTTSGGTVPVTASVGGMTASATISVTASPDGDATRGETLFGASGANCASCHGMTAQGSQPNADGTTYTIAGNTYSFPAPGIDAEDGNAAAEWSAPLFAVASRADLDDQAVTLRLPMPDWLTEPNPATGKTLTTQDFADIFAYLKTLQ
jgi:mono/diheme cytochrome c family protein